MTFGYYKNCLYTQRYKFSSKKKKIAKESQYMVSHPETGSDPPIGLDQGSGRDTLICNAEFDSNSSCLDRLNNFDINSLQKL